MSESPDVFKQDCNFIKKETLAQVFSCAFCEVSKNTFFTEHLWMSSSVVNLVFYVQIFVLICYL